MRDPVRISAARQDSRGIRRQADLCGACEAIGVPFEQGGKPMTGRYGHASSALVSESAVAARGGSFTVGPG